MTNVHHPTEAFSMIRYATALGIAAIMIGGCGPTDLKVEPIAYWAKEGDALAQYNLGLMYETGQGVTQDIEQARRWYRAATHSDAEATETNPDVDAGGFGQAAGRAAGATEREKEAKRTLVRMYATLEGGLQDASQAASAAKQRLDNLP